MKPFAIFFFEKKAKIWDGPLKPPRITIMYGQGEIGVDRTTSGKILTENQEKSFLDFLLCGHTLHKGLSW